MTELPRAAADALVERGAQICWARGQAAERVRALPWDDPRILGLAEYCTKKLKMGYPSRA